MTCASHKCLEIQITIHSPRQNHKSNKFSMRVWCRRSRREASSLSADQIISLSAASGQSGRALNQRVHSLGGAPETTRPGARAPSAKRVRLDGSRCAPHRHIQQLLQRFLIWQPHSNFWQLSCNKSKRLSTLKAKEARTQTELRAKFLSTRAPSGAAEFVNFRKFSYFYRDCFTQLFFCW
jgi:hypothetical protein